MEKIRKVMALFFIPGMLSCAWANKRTKASTADKYRKLPALFKGEAAHIRTGGFILFKSVILNGKKDTCTLPGDDSTAIHNLLQPFTNIDLNKPIYRDAYDTATLYDPFSGRRSVIYKSKIKHTNPFEITMELDKQGDIQLINIHSGTKNLIYEFRQDLTYQHNKVIRMINYQKIAFLTPKELEVTVTIVAKNGR